MPQLTFSGSHISGTRRSIGRSSRGAIPGQCQCISCLCKVRALTASKTPRSTRRAARAPQLWTRPHPIERSPKQIPSEESQIRGPNFFIKMFEGSSNKMYPTNKIITGLVLVLVQEPFRKDTYRRLKHDCRRPGGGRHPSRRFALRHNWCDQSGRRSR